MGSWRADQSKEARRYIWGKTRGEGDETWKDFTHRLRALTALAGLRAEKIGTEIQLWRQVQEPSGKKYWMSCLRFIDDGWGYWTVMYRPDERRWRTTDIDELPIRKALDSAADFYTHHLKEV